jgi:hypothetical protein
MSPTPNVPARAWALGERLHAKMKRFFAAPLGPDAKPLEIREAILEDVERQIAPVGDGRRVFPWQRIVCRVVAPDGTRGGCEAALGDLDTRVRTRLAEVRCEAPRGLDVRVTVLKRTPADWETGRLFAVDYRPAPEAPADGPAASRPALLVVVVSGSASQPTYAFDAQTVLVGRGADPVDHAGRVRRNHLAFADADDEVARTVGRAHARFAWDAASGEYRVYDEGSSNGTHVLREGVSIVVPPRDPRGVRVRSGDEIQFGRAQIRIKYRTSPKT